MTKLDVSFQHIQQKLKILPCQFSNRELKAKSGFSSKFSDRGSYWTFNYIHETMHKDSGASPCDS